MNPSDFFARQEDRQARESSYTRRTWGLDVPDMTIGEVRAAREKHITAHARAHPVQPPAAKPCADCGQPTTGTWCPHCANVRNGKIGAAKRRNTRRGA